jgi:DNA-binding CsgD family transcriptional regulator
VRAQATSLLERDLELARAAEIRDAAAAGAGGVILVEGPAGIGKTRFLFEVREAAVAEHGFKVLGARASELERGLPHGVALQLFERALRGPGPERRAAARTLLLQDGPPPDAGLGLLSSLYWLVEELSADTPLLLVVDDVQWADLPSLTTLAYLAPRLADLKVLLVLAFRTEAGGDGPTPALAELLALPELNRISLGALSEDAAGAIAAELLGHRIDDGAATACHELTGGNPLLLSQLITSLIEDGIEPTPESIGELETLAPRSLARTVTVRVGRLGSDAVGVARAVAVLGDGANLPVVATLAGLTPEDALEAAAQLSAAGLFSTGEELGFAHPLLRSAVNADLSAHDLALAHARAAAALRDRGERSDRIAAHLLASPPADDPAAIATLREAAAEARTRGAHETASRLLARALDESPDRETRAELLAELGHSERAAGDPAAAATHLERSLELTSTESERVQRGRALAHATAESAGIGPAVAVLDRVLAEVADAESEHALQLDADIVMFSHLDSDLSEGLAERGFDRFLDLPGETPAQRTMLAVLAIRAAFGDGTASDALELARRASGDGTLLSEHGPQSMIAQIPAQVGALADADEFAAAEVERSLKAAREASSPIGVATTSIVRANAVLRRGDLAEAEADAEVVGSIVDQFRNPALDATIAPGVAEILGQARAARGDFDGAQAALERFGLAGELQQVARLRVASRGLVRMSEGRLEEAIADFDAAAETHAAIGFGYVPDAPWRSWKAIALSRLGREGEAEPLAEEDLRLAGRWGTPWGTGLALIAIGVSKRGEEGLNSLREAVAVLSPSTAKLHLALAQIELGALLRRNGERIAAREALRDGLEQATRCGAVLLAERAHSELKTAGARPRRLMFSGVESLTASQRRTAGLAADGMSNKEIAQALFLTVKTVEGHLGNAYRKLGIRSRDELPEALRGGSPQD